MYKSIKVRKFVEYEMVVYLDSGIKVLTNIDKLFELEKGSFYAVMDYGFREEPSSHTLKNYKIAYCLLPDPEMAVWPLTTTERGAPALPPYFDVGVMMFVHEPGMATAGALLDALRVNPPSPFAEQEILNVFSISGEMVKAVQYPAAGYTAKEATMDMVERKLWNMVDLEGMVLPAGDEFKKKMPPSSWLAQAKDVMFARKNLPAMATLAASSAATGMVAAAANPAICFGFYAVFMAAIAVVTISLRAI